MGQKQAVVLQQPCAHANQATITEVERPPQGCQVCLATGGSWVHLRTCLTCGHVGCCDASPGRHATGHFHATSHPLVTSAELGESWVWCFADSRAVSE